MIVYKETETLARELGVPARTLYALSNARGRHYRETVLPKSGGGERHLCVPSEALKRVQRAIAERLLAYEPVSPYATAYRVAGGIGRNVAPHVGKEKILKLDIAHFFDSIRYSSVKECAFPATRYSEANRILLSMLCYYRDSLPQGAPTSPVISNLVMRSFDETVGAWCADRKIAYTRYCDDMTFSGDFEEREVIAFVRRELRTRGFLLHPQKTVVATKDQRQVVTGIVVNSRPQPSKEYRREIRQEVHFCKRFGVAEHLRREGVADTEAAYLRHLIGKVNYVLQYLPEDAEFLRYRWDILQLMRTVGN